MRSLSQFFDNTIYVRVYKNEIKLRHIETKNERVVLPDQAFTTERLLIGHFNNAENTLKSGLAKIYKGKGFTPSPKILIQQMEMDEGGLSEVEKRILKEISMASGARSVLVWEGQELMDREVLQQMKKNGHS